MFTPTRKRSRPVGISVHARLITKFIFQTCRQWFLSLSFIWASSDRMIRLKTAISGHAKQIARAIILSHYTIQSPFHHRSSTHDNMISYGSGVVNRRLSILTTYARRLKSNTVIMLIMTLDLTLIYSTHC